MKTLFRSNIYNQNIMLCNPKCQISFPGLPLLMIYLLIKFNSVTCDYLTQLRDLDHECIHSFQCLKTSNAACYDAEYNELNDIDTLGKFIKNNYKKQTQVNRETKNWGICKCHIGYRLSAKKECHRVQVTKDSCYRTQECLIRDFNSHCDQETNHCKCNSGHFYDTHLDKCAEGKKFGANCDTDIECRISDMNLDCISSICICRNPFQFDVITHKCKDLRHLTHTFIHKSNKNRDQTNNTNDGHKNRSNGIDSSDIMITIIVVISFIFALLIKYSRRVRDVGNVDLCNWCNNNENHRRTPNLDPVIRFSRNVELVVNNESADSHNPHNETVVNVIPPRTPSVSSLPPYDILSFNQDNNDFQLPTYEEALYSAQIDLKNS